MYKKAIYTLRSNERLTPAVWRMTLEGDTQWITAPGQFVNVELDGPSGIPDFLTAHL